MKIINLSCTRDWREMHMTSRLKWRVREDAYAWLAIVNYSWKKIIVSIISLLTWGLLHYSKDGHIPVPAWEFYWFESIARARWAWACAPRPAYIYISIYGCSWHTWKLAPHRLQVQLQRFHILAQSKTLWLVQSQILHALIADPRIAIFI